MNYAEYISVNPNIRFGKPCVNGTRISVYDVLSWLASGMSFEEIISDFPQLNKEQILACLSFAADKERKLKIAV
ncbi:MAG: DUF433 domain-containing protein [Ferruginibacter sp.]|nr:DUF433 domain-containing protein [Chitinophagaceae bacterium]